MSFEAQKCLGFVAETGLLLSLTFLFCRVYPVFSWFKIALLTMISFLCCNSLIGLAAFYIYDNALGLKDVVIPLGGLTLASLLTAAIVKIRGKPEIKSQRPFADFKESVFLSAAALMATVLFFSTWPDLTPIWGNVDLGNHINMIAAFHSRLGLSQDPAFNAQYDIHSILTAYSYPMTVHFYLGLFSQITGIHFLYALHVLVCLLYGMLVAVPALILDVKNKKNISVFLFVFIVLCLAPSLRTFINAGWLAHLLCTTLLFLCVYTIDITRTAARNGCQWRIYFVLEGVCLFLVLISYILLVPIFLFYSFIRKLESTSVQKAVVTTLIIIGLGLLVAYPIPAVGGNIEGVLANIFNPAADATVNRVLDPTDDPAIISFISWILIGISGAGLYLHKEARATRLLFVIFVTGILVGSLVLGPGSYAVEKLWTSSIPVLVVAAVLAFKGYRRTFTTKFRNKQWLATMSTSLLAIVIFSGIARVYHLKNAAAPWTNMAMLTWDQYFTADFIKARKISRVMYVDMNGPVQFVLRQLTGDDPWDGVIIGYRVRGPKPLEAYDKFRKTTKSPHYFWFAQKEAAKAALEHISNHETLVDLPTSILIRGD